MVDYEKLSLDYDRCYNKPYEDYLKHLSREQSTKSIELIKWGVMFVIGLFTGLVALFIDYIVKKLSKLKFDTVENSILECSVDGCLALSLLYLLLFNVGFVIIASALVVMEPIAGGSGIPEIKCYLNGVKVPRVGRLRTLVSKSVGVLFSVAGGLFVGKEGPMIHSGAIIGAGIPQFQSIAVEKINLKQFHFFRTDRDKRDFVSGGAAAGVAAAFGAPIGGVLFSLEEGCSFWNQKLTWRTFFCSMAATYSLNFFLSGIDIDSWGYFYLPGLINFGVFKCYNETGIGCRLWNIVDLAIFILMGFLGGLLGGIFNAINTRLTKHRMKHVQHKHRVVRILEAMLVAAVTTTVSFISAMALGDCREIPANLRNASTATIEDTVRTYFCDPGYYNDMATLFFNSQEEAIKQLFHQPDTDGFSLQSLAIFFVCFFLLACWTYGTNVPSGLFVPSLLCGAAYGRFVARLLVLIGYGNNAIHSGTYALVGAAAFLGGVVRMTISLTVILIESTNEISYGLPLMLVLMVAKWSGDLFNEGLYDIHIKLRGVPFLEWEAPNGMERLKACDIMQRSLKFLYPLTRVTSIVQILKTTVHNAFPVVSIIDKKSPQKSSRRRSETLSALTDVHSPLDSTLAKNVRLRMDGIILRSQLVMLLKSGTFHDEHGQRLAQSTPTYEELTKDYPRYPDIFDLTRNYTFQDTSIMDASIPVTYKQQDLKKDKNGGIHYSELCVHGHKVSARSKYTCKAYCKDLSKHKGLKKHFRTFPIQTNDFQDISSYMNRSPYTVYPNTPVPQVFNLFRSMGLRHLPVVSHEGQVMGMITRHDLTHEYLEHCQEASRHTGISDNDQQ